MLVATQLSLVGLYRPPLFRSLPLEPPQTIISLPVQTAVCRDRPPGALTLLVSTQVSVVRLYLPPVEKLLKPPLGLPPQTIISLPVQTAVCEERVAGEAFVGTQLSEFGLYRPPVFKK